MKLGLSSKGGELGSELLKMLGYIISQTWVTNWGKIPITENATSTKESWPHLAHVIDRERHWKNEKGLRVAHKQGSDYEAYYFHLFIINS